MPTTFSYLLDKVLEGTATEQERRELIRMLQSDEYDDQLTAKGLSKQKFQESELWNEMSREVYQEIEPVIYSDRKIKPLQKSPAWLAAAAVIVVTIAAGTWFIAKDVHWFGASVTKQSEDSWPAFEGKQVVDLPDGTRVVLNENSTIRYSTSFFETREVLLTGEATFDVMHDPFKPFLVHTGKVTTKVLGTEFNVKAYPDEPKITVTVLRGLVEVGDGQRVYGQIRPNEQIAVNTTTNDFVQQKTNALDAVQWKSRFLILDNVSLEDAAKIISKKFNVQIRFENDALKKCRFVGTFLNDESLNHVLTSMTMAMKIKFEIDKNARAVTLSGKGCN